MVNQSMNEAPHITVATIVEKQGRFLMVKESFGADFVYNQPAGHLEVDETLIEAAVRETLEETAWDVAIRHFLGIYQATSPHNNVHYVRHCFIADPLQQREDYEPDPDIFSVHWLTMEEIKQNEYKLRSPMVLKVLEDYLKGIKFPLSLLG